MSSGTDYPLGQTIDIRFTTRSFSTGAPTDLAGSPAVAVFADNSTTGITAGVTLSAPLGSVVGRNNVRIVATGANGFASGSSYHVEITAGTVGGVSVVGEVVGNFTIERSSARALIAAGVNTTQLAGQTVSASGTVTFPAATIASTSNITAGTISTVNTLATNAIAAASIQSNAITSTKIQDGAITSGKFAVSAITGAAIAADAITSAKIQDNAITANKIATDAITSTKIAAAALNGKGDWNIGKTGYALSATGLDSTVLPANFITATSITDGAFVAAKFAAGSLNGKGDWALASNYTAGRATNLDNLDAAISSRATSTDINTSIETYRLDHLLLNPVAGTDVADNTVIAKMVSKATPNADWDTFSNVNDSLEALSDRQTQLDTAISGNFTAIANHDDNMQDYFRVALRSDQAIFDDKSDIITEINADLGTGAGDYDNRNDSTEAIRDRGDSSWITATGFSTLTEADIRNAVGLAAANLDTQLGDIPTVAEFNARTLLSADYFDPAADTVATVTNLTNLPSIPANWLTATGLATDAVEEIADQVWDEALADHLAAGSTGNALNAAGSAGDPWSTALPGAYGPGTAGKIIGDNIDATISSRAAETTLNTKIPNNLVVSAGGSVDSLVQGIVNTVFPLEPAVGRYANNFGSFVGGESSTLNMKHLEIVATGIVEASGSNSPTQVQTGLSETTDNHYTGMIILFTSGAESGQSRVIDNYVGSSGVVSWLAPLTGTPADADNFRILPWADVNTVNTVTDVTTVNGIATNSVSADSLATDAVNEIRDAILADSTPFNGADVALILADTGDIQSKVGTLTDLGSGATVAANLADMAGATFNTTTDSQEALRNNMPSNFNLLVISPGGSVDALVQGYLNSPINETTAGRIAGNFDTFFENADAATTKVVDDVGSGGGGGGDATAANQTTIINHLTDMKGAGWTSTDTLENIYDDTNELQTDWVDGGRLDLILDACSTHTAADAADAVWDEQSAGHTGPGTAGSQLWTDIDAILVDTAALNDTKIPDTLSLANINSEVDTALADIHLDHLFQTAYDATAKPGAADALLNEMVEDNVGVTRYTAAALAQAPSGGGGGGGDITQILGTSITETIAGDLANNFSQFFDVNPTTGKTVDDVGGSAVGAGAISYPVTVNDTVGNPVGGVDVWITTDEPGTDIVAGTLVTNSFGLVTFLLDAGTYYMWRQSDTHEFPNPTEITVS